MSIQLQQNINSPVLRGRVISDLNLPYIPFYETEKFVFNGASQGNITIQDAEFDQLVPESYFNKGFLNVPFYDYEIENADPGVASLDGVDVLRLSDGVCRIYLKYKNVRFKIDVDVSTKFEGDIVNNYLNPAPGSLAEHIANSVSSLAQVGMSPSVEGGQYSTKNYTSKTFSRNPGLWCSGIDFTGLAVEPKSGQARTLITPRHIIGCAHWQLPVGSAVWFVDSSGSVYEREVLSKVTHPQYSQPYAYYADLTVYSLSADLPQAIAPFKALPQSAISSRLPQLSKNLLPIVSANQDERLVVRLWASDADTCFFRSPAIRSPFVQAWNDLHQSVRTLDSGCPDFAIINEEAVLISLKTSTLTGPSIRFFAASINQMIADADAAAGISTGYTLTEADLSAFPTYN